MSSDGERTLNGTAVSAPTSLSPPTLASSSASFSTNPLHPGPSTTPVSFTPEQIDVLHAQIHAFKLLQRCHALDILGQPTLNGAAVSPQISLTLASFSTNPLHPGQSSIAPLRARPLSEINHAPGDPRQRRLRRVATIEFDSDSSDPCN
jgi:hypothetical protein